MKKIKNVFLFAILSILVLPFFASATMTFDPASPQPTDTPIIITCTDPANYLTAFYNNPFWGEQMLFTTYCNGWENLGTFTFSYDIGGDYTILEIDSSYGSEPPWSATTIAEVEALPEYLGTYYYTLIAPETCWDGIQNQDETDIDIGGVCGAPPETCWDGIQNQDETDIDIGGVCGAPPETCWDGIQNQDETGIDTGGVCGTPPPAPAGAGISFFKPPLDGGTYSATDMISQTATALGATMGENGIGKILALIAGILVAFLVMLAIVQMYKEVSEDARKRHGKIRT